MSELNQKLYNKTSVLCGFSGVGKSSLLNKMNPSLALRTKEVSQKNERGTHTTRHSELIEIDFGNENRAKVVDTPGFSYLKFDNVMPSVIKDCFEDIAVFADKCRFSDCLHIEEVGCHVIENIDKIAPSRYESYRTFIKEALEYKDKITYSGNKKEKKVKTLKAGLDKEVKIVKLGSKAREKSRKNQKQNLNFISSLDDAYYNEEIDE